MLTVAPPRLGGGGTHGWNRVCVSVCLCLLSLSHTHKHTHTPIHTRTHAHKQARTVRIRERDSNTFFQVIRTICTDSTIPKNIYIILNVRHFTPKSPPGWEREEVSEFQKYTKLEQTDGDADHVRHGVLGQREARRQREARGRSSRQTGIAIHRFFPS